MIARRTLLFALVALVAVTTALEHIVATGARGHKYKFRRFAF